MRCVELHHSLKLDRLLFPATHRDTMTASLNEEVLIKEEGNYESGSTDSSAYHSARTTRSTRPFLFDIRKPRRALRGCYSIYTDRARSWRKMHLHRRRWHGWRRSRSHAVRWY